MISRGLAWVTLRPAITTPPERFGPHAHEGLDQLALAVALDARDAEHLAGVHLEVEVGHGGDAAVVVDPELGHREHRLARLRRAPCRW